MADAPHCITDTAAFVARGIDLEADHSFSARLQLQSNSSPVSQAQEDVAIDPLLQFGATVAGSKPPAATYSDHDDTATVPVPYRGAGGALSGGLPFSE